jgi:CRISPR-associated protein Cmr1
VQAGKMDRIHETGIIGSMRWWYEVIVRGLGGDACDPSKADCAFDEEKDHEGLCDVCRVFGATGWKRRFRLVIRDTDVDPDERVKNVQIWKSRHTSKWYFPAKLNDKPRSGKLTIQIQSLATDFRPEVVAGLVQFIADWAGIGARVQMGFGVIELANGRVDTQPLYNRLQTAASNRQDPELPSLQNIFLARVSSKDGRPFDENETFNLKYDLRRLFEDDTKLRHFVMGTTTKGERIAAKVKMSRPYNSNNEMRVWGWIPKKLPSAQNFENRDAIVQAIYLNLREKYNIQVWREMNSARDTVIRDNIDVNVFLRTLLGLEEDPNA